MNSKKSRKEVIVENILIKTMTSIPTKTKDLIKIGGFQKGKVHLCILEGFKTLLVKVGTYSVKTRNRTRAAKGSIAGLQEV